MLAPGTLLSQRGGPGDGRADEEPCRRRGGISRFGWRGDPGRGYHEVRPPGGADGAGVKTFTVPSGTRLDRNHVAGSVARRYRRWRFGDEIPGPTLWRRTCGVRRLLESAYELKTDGPPISVIY